MELMEPRQKLRLCVTIRNSVPQTYDFDKPEVTIGRARDNQLVIASSFISRHHGCFRLRDSGWTYQDVESKNGTVVLPPNPMARPRMEPLGVVPYALVGGERLKMGDVLLEVLPFTQDHSSELLGAVKSSWTSRQAMTLFDVHERSNQEALRTLYHAVQRLSVARDEAAVYEVVRLMVERAVPAVSHLIVVEVDNYAPDKPTEELNVIRRWHWARNPRDTSVPEVSRTLLQRVLTEETSILYTGGGSPTASMHAASILSSICVPLRGYQTYKGMLQADCRGPEGLPYGDGGILHESDYHLLTLLGEQVAATLDRFRVARRIENMFEGFVKASVKAIESRDVYTANHSDRVMQYCTRVAEAIHAAQEGHFQSTIFTDTSMRSLRYAALLHDFGKVGVKESVLLKAEKLMPEHRQEIAHRFQLAALELKVEAATVRHQAFSTASIGFRDALEQDEFLQERQRWLDEELKWLFSLLGTEAIQEPDARRLRKLCTPIGPIQLLREQEVEDLLACRGTLTPSDRLEIEKHAWNTYCFLKEIPWPEELGRIPDIAGSHHLKMNGAGYPQSLGDKELPLEVRILTICDIYDALTGNGRTYRAAPYTHPDALDILYKEAQKAAIDKNVLEILNTVIKEPLGRD